MGDFVTLNKPDWNELEKLIRRAQKSVKKLSPEELSRLDVLYRRTTVHLSQVRTRTRDKRLAAYLNGLTAAAHSLIYLPSKEPVLKGLVTFVVEGFARSVIRNWRFHLASAALLIGGAFVAFFAGSLDPVALYAFMPAADPRGPGAPREVLLEMLRSGREQGGGTKFAFASFLFSHNLKVGMMSMALGILAAVPSVILIFYNGVILGAFVAVHHQAGLATEMWAWILPHGITEIGAIILCGGVGLQLGWAVINPGLRTRTKAIADTASDCGRTVGGAAAMLVAAAIIESYLRQSHLSDAARLIFAAASGVFWLLYLLHGFARERAAQRFHARMSSQLLETENASVALE